MQQKQNNAAPSDGKQVEPFLGNALHYPWRIVRMNDYKTVKEVCALTGLTGKHLYYFHHENVVRAVAYANYSVAGNDGYKLYDEAGVEKLRQIALYYQLGLKRNEIRDLMLDPDYDCDRVLQMLLERMQGERERLGQQITAVEYLQKIGLANALDGILRSHTLEELGKMLTGLRQASAPTAEPESPPAGVK